MSTSRPANEARSTRSSNQCWSERSRAGLRTRSKISASSTEMENRTPVADLSRGPSRATPMPKRSAAPSGTRTRTRASDGGEARIARRYRPFRSKRAFTRRPPISTWLPLEDGGAARVAEISSTGVSIGIREGRATWEKSRTPGPQRRQATPAAPAAAATKRPHPIMRRLRPAVILSLQWPRLGSPRGSRPGDYEDAPNYTVSGWRTEASAPQWRVSVPTPL